MPFPIISSERQWHGCHRQISLDGNINFSYTGSYSHGDFYVKVSNLGFSDADYVLI